MLVDRLKELKKKSGMTVKQIVEQTNLPERTVNRVLTGETPNPYVDTVHRIVTVLGGSLDEVLADTKLVVGEQNLAELQENVEVVTAEIELLKMQIKHKDEIIALHNYYNKLKPLEE